MAGAHRPPGRPAPRPGRPAPAHAHGLEALAAARGRLAAGATNRATERPQAIDAPRSTSARPAPAAPRSRARRGGGPAAGRPGRSWPPAPRAPRTTPRRSIRPWPWAPAPLRSTSAASSGWSSDGRRAVDRRRGPPSGRPPPARRSPSRRSRRNASASASVAVGRVAVVQGDAGLVGHDVARHSALDGHRLELLGVGAPVEHDLAPGPVGHPLAAAVPGGGWRCGPVKGRAVCARTPRSVTRTRMVPWQPASTSAPVGSPEDGGVPGQELRPLLPQLEQAAVGAADLLAGVEAPGDVDRRARARSWPGRASPPGRPSCRTRRRPTACRPRAWAPRCRPAGPCRGGRPGPGAAPRPRAVRATTLSPTRSTSSQGQARERVARPGRRAPPRCWLERGDGHQLPGGRERRSPIGSGAGAVVAQDLVQLRLVVALAFAQPLDDEHARHEELAARVLAPAAGPDGHAPGGHDAAGDLLAGLGVDDRDGRDRGSSPRRGPRPCRSARRRSPCSGCR